MKRGLKIISILTLLAVLLAACATPTPVTVEKTVVVTKIVAGTPQVITATPAPTQAPKPTEAAPSTTVLRVGTGDGGDGLTPHQAIIQNFEDKNPNIIVQLEAVAGRDYYARLLTQLAAKAAPDIMQVEDDAVPMFLSKGAFVVLDDLLKTEKFDPSIYLPGLLDPGKFNGKQYLLPKDYSPLAVYYNKKLFDEARWPIPRRIGRGMTFWIRPKS